MNKSVLVIDKPESCDGCDFSSIAGYGPKRPFCSALNIFIDNPNKVCDECPLKDLPMSRPCNYYDFEHYTSGYDKGWNDFRDAICGEGTVKHR